MTEKRRVAQRFFWLAALFTLAIGARAAAFTMMASNLGGWARGDLAFRLNPANCPPSVSNALDASLALWNSVPGSRLKLSRGPDATEGVAELKAKTLTQTPLIVCDPNFGATAWSSFASARAVPAIGMIFNWSPISSGGLALNVEPGAGADVNGYDLNKLSVVMAHEIGHVLGLGHSADPAALMYFSAGYKQNLSLSDDDADGIAYLYGRDEALGGDPPFGSCGRVLGPGDGPPGFLGSIALALCLLAPLGAWLSAKGSQADRHSCEAG